MARAETFDLQAFRKEIEGRLEEARAKGEKAGRFGWHEEDAFQNGAIEALEGVLALLPGEGD